MKIVRARSICRHPSPGARRRDALSSKTGGLFFSRSARYQFWSIAALALGFIALTVSEVCAEWPQFRADAARSGYVTGQVPSELSLRWAHRSQHRPAPAWLGIDTRMPFDHAYQPVIAQGLLYFGSSADGKVYALDAKTGAERWTFYTGAAVRFAPALWGGRLFVASDDGWLYCLSGETGELIWKRLGGPKEDMLLGNARMISRWPARGGPVVLDGIVYFAAGIWPSEGIYLCALDAASGEVRWLNAESGGLEWDQPHGGARAQSGISAQGYLAATAKHLFIPTGRGVPATFSRADGQLRQFPLQAYGRVGGADVVAVDDNFFNSGHWFDAGAGKSRGLAVPPVDPAAHKLHMAGHLPIAGGLANPLAAAPDKVVFAAGHRLSASKWIEEKMIERKGEEQTVKHLRSVHLWPDAGTETVPKSDGADRRFSGQEYIETPAFGFDYNHITISVWVNASNLSGRFTLFDNRDQAGCPGIEIGSGRGGSKRISVITPGVWVVETRNGVLETNQWRHIVYTRNGLGSTHKIYVDGVAQPLVTSLADAYRSTSTLKDIGRRGNDNQYFEGLMDALAVYGRALSRDEVASLFKAANPQQKMGLAGRTQLPVREGLLLYHLLQADPAGASSRVTDFSGVGRHGTFVSTRFHFVNAPHEVTALILVGPAIVLGGSGQVSIMHPPQGGPASSIWSMPVEGVVHGLAFAGDHLYASTDHGLIYCFGPNQQTGADWREVKAQAAPYGENAQYASAAQEIIRLTGVSEGYAVDLGCGDGALAYELARRTRLRIYAIERDPGLVRQAREKLDRAGLYGSRVTVHLGDPAKSKYPNYFADLAVSGRSVAEGEVPKEAIAEMLRLNRPWGGVACTGPVGSMQTRVRGALDGTGAWTHQYADAANTAVSADDLLKSPLGMLWFCDYAGIELPMRHGRGPAPLFSNGRLFIMGLHGVYAMDAYNGRRLWDYSIPDILRAYDQHHLAGTSITGGTFCLEKDILYVRHQNRCLRLDAATGKKLAEYTLPKDLADPQGTWGFIAVSDGALFGSVANEEHVVKFPYSRGGAPSMEELFSESTALFALDAATGRRRWTYRAKYSIRHNAIAIGDGRVCLIDRPPAQEDLLDQQRRRGIEPADRILGELVALDAATGQILWRKSDGIFGTLLAMSVEHDVLLMSYQPTRFQIASERGGKLAAFRASDGRALWEIAANYASRPILNGRTIYAQPGAWDLLTGQRNEFTLTRSYGCSIVAGSRNLLAFRSATLGFRDLTRPDARTENYGGVRPGCWLNAIAAGGLLLMPDDTDKCTCSYLNKAYIALQPVAVSDSAGAR